VSPIRVKICGITTPDDALVAVRSGADYVGVIFAASPRRVDLARARDIRAAAAGVNLVAVFKNQPVDEVARLVAGCGADLVQLHGDETPEYCDEVRRRTGKPVIKAFDSTRIPDTDHLAAYRTTSYFLFDVDMSSGGEVDRARVWEEVARIRRQGFRVFLAGALNASNVRDAVLHSHAFAVDVCRGVEQSPGIKDPEAVARFVVEARS
jgi:phosphoribosylanthranilate isomerase